MARFITPRGTPVDIEVRDGTNDWNVAFSCLNEDEYRLRDLRLTGWALDIGAHIGAATVALLADNPELRVLAVEPLPENLALLERNTAPWQDRVRILPGALAHGKTKVIHYGDPEGVHAFVGNQHIARGKAGWKHRATGYSLAALIRRAGQPLVFAKFDCEGCEHDALDTAAAKAIPLIRGELHDGGNVRPFEMRAGVLA